MEDDESMEEATALRLPSPPATLLITVFTPAALLAALVLLISWAGCTSGTLRNSPAAYLLLLTISIENYPFAQMYVVYTEREHNSPGV